MLFSCLEPARHISVAYMCEICVTRWSGISTLTSTVEKEDILVFFACPVHGIENSQVKILDVRTASAKRRR